VRAWLAVAILWTFALAARAQVAPPASDVSEQPAEPSLYQSLLSRVHLAGFVSQGGFVSTANDYIGNSSRGSLKFFEAGINVSVDLTDNLRAGMQFVSRSVGDLSEEVPRLDWALLDYRFRKWLGLRAGVIKMPLGLYNEYVSIDASRTAILLPQSVYPLRNRDALISHTGFAVYGNVSLAKAGALDYQAWLGTLTIPRSALELSGGTLSSVDTRYVAGGRLFWLPPVEGLRVGATYMRASVDFNVRLDPASVGALIEAGLVPATYDGGLLIQQNPTSFWVASAEYTYGNWLFAVEYARFLKHQLTSLPAVLPTIDEDSERFYALATYRLTPMWELGGYYSVIHADVNDRRGDGAAYERPFYAYQRDLAASVRFDVNPYWLWKLEGHFIDGTTDLYASTNEDPKRFWGLFLLRTTVTFQ
jgi:hypothetical protein